MGPLPPETPWKVEARRREKKGKERREEEERGGWRKKKGDEPPHQRANPGSTTVPFRGVVLRKFVLQALRPFGKQSYSTKFALQLCV